MQFFIIRVLNRNSALVRPERIHQISLQRLMPMGITIKTERVTNFA